MQTVLGGGLRGAYGKLTGSEEGGLVYTPLRNPKPKSQFRRQAMAISPNRIFSLKCLGSTDRQHQILRGSVLSGKVDLAPDDITASDTSGAQWAALDAGSSQVFIKCLEDFKSSKFPGLGALGQSPSLEGKKDGSVVLASKTAAEDATLTGTRWTVIDLGGNRVVLECDFLGKSSK